MYYSTTLYNKTLSTTAMTKYKENISILLHIVTENSIENGIYKKYIIKTLKMDYENLQIISIHLE